LQKFAESDDTISDYFQKNPDYREEFQQFKYDLLKHGGSVDDHGNRLFPEETNFTHLVNPDTILEGPITEEEMDVSPVDQESYVKQWNRKRLLTEFFKDLGRRSLPKDLSDELKVMPYDSQKLIGAKQYAYALRSNNEISPLEEIPETKELAPNYDNKILDYVHKESASGNLESFSRKLKKIAKVETDADDSFHRYLKANRLFDDVGERSKDSTYKLLKAPDIDDRIIKLYRPGDRIEDNGQKVHPLVQKYRELKEDETGSPLYDQPSPSSRLQKYKEQYKNYIQNDPKTTLQEKIGTFEKDEEYELADDLYNKNKVFLEGDNNSMKVSFIDTRLKEIKDSDLNPNEKLDKLIPLMKEQDEESKLQVSSIKNHGKGLFGKKISQDDDLEKIMEMFPGSQHQRFPENFVESFEYSVAKSEYDKMDRIHDEILKNLDRIPFEDDGERMAHIEKIKKYYENRSNDFIKKYKNLSRRSPYSENDSELYKSIQDKIQEVKRELMKNTSIEQKRRYIDSLQYSPPDDVVNQKQSKTVTKVLKKFAQKTLNNMDSSVPKTAEKLSEMKKYQKASKILGQSKLPTDVKKNFRFADEDSSLAMDKKNEYLDKGKWKWKSIDDELRQKKLDSLKFGSKTMDELYQRKIELYQRKRKIKMKPFFSKKQDSSVDEHFNNFVQRKINDHNDNDGVFSI
jgi:hypothetical protein